MRGEIVVKDITLPSLIDRASNALLSARSSAEVLDARDLANAAYTAAKVVGRLAKAKHAHDDVVAAAHRAQADALEIEAGAKRRLADEYDAAQERGEVAKAGKPNCSKAEQLPGPDAIGLTRKDIHEARQVRDAETRDPGVIRRTLDEQLEQGKEPTKAAIRRAITQDDDAEDEDEDDGPDNNRDAFLVFSDTAMKLAKYSGPIDDAVVKSAKATASAWCRLVETLEGSKS